MDPVKERALVNEFLETGAEPQFRPLYKLHADYLYRLAFKLNNGDAMLAEDVLQEAWIRAITKLPEFKWESALRTWLGGIVINCSREHRRKPVSTSLQDSRADRLAGSQAKLDSKMDVRQALCQLPEGYREILVLHDLEGYTHQEIGLMLGINEGTSKSQLFNARKAIKKLINHE